MFSISHRFKRLKITQKVIKITLIIRQRKYYNYWTLDINGMNDVIVFTKNTKERPNPDSVNTVLIK